MMAEAMLRPGFYWVVDALAPEAPPFVAQWDDQWHIPGSDIPEPLMALRPVSERLEPPRRENYSSSKV